MTVNKNRILLMLFITCILRTWHPADLWALNAEQEFYRAEVYFNSFMKDSDLIKYRDNWLVCIDKFKSSYQKDPSGKFAPASLYMMGKLWQELFYKSGIKSDKNEALDIFARIVKRFPDSDYRKKAEKSLEKMNGTDSDDNKSGNRKADSEEIPHLKKKISSQKKDTDLDKKVVTLPVKQRGKIFKESKASYHKSIKNKSSKELARIFKENEPDEKVSDFKAPTADATIVNGLRVWSNPNYTRIVVDGDRQTDFTHKLLEKDLSHHKPQRLYIDFENSILGKNIPKVIPIDDDLLRGARAGQRTPASVRVVIDIKSFKTYKIFSLNNPFRTIIDVWGQDAGVSHATGSRKFPEQKSEHRNDTEKPYYEASVRPKKPVEKSHMTPHDLAKQLALGVKRIIIDPGHGGHDGGAPGYLRGVREKDVVLKIAHRLARKIRKELGCEVILTRSNDRFLTLEERTAIANTKNADLFISIHANASTNKNAYGIETYFLNLATDDDAIRVAARENATSRKNISDLQTILNDLMKNSKINESSRLASHIQKSIYSHLKRHYSKIKNKGVKQAPFYVLLGAQMPSILIETSFISNKQECKRLINGNYQEHMCNAIVKGIRKYIKETSPTALLRDRPGTKG